ncbi:hypothetical protein BGP77_15800 [Saccharospirillum sp. MSK14-1]|nr:hypothetical protein BGP77_15800 [Saccharospirillum sp. MSK14-1]
MSVCLWVGSVAAADLSVGLGAAILPPLDNDDDWQVFPAPSFRYQAGGYSVSSQGPGISADLVPSRLVSLGPLLRYSGGRDEANLPDIPASAEMGVSVGSGIPWRVIGVPLPGVITAGAEAVTTWPGGHESPYGQIKLGWVLPATERWTLISNASLSYFGDDYADRFFSLDATQANRAGTQPFDADAGWQDASLGVVSVYQFKPRWSAVVVYSYSRYFGDAADSPATEILNDRDRQVMVFSVSYQWLGERGR